MRSLLKILLIIMPLASHAGSFDVSYPEDSVSTATTNLGEIYSGTDIVLQRADSSKGNTTITIGTLPASVGPSLVSLSQIEVVEQKELTRSGSTFSFTDADPVSVGKSAAEIEIELIIVRGVVALEFYGENNRTVLDIRPLTSEGYGKVGDIVNVLIEDVTYINQLAVTFAQSNSDVDWQSFDPAATRAGNSLEALNTLVAEIEAAIDSLTLKD